MKAVVVGFGKMGMLHTALLNAHPEVDVVAIIDNEEKILNFFRKLNNSIKTFKSVDKLITEVEFDCVVITTPHYLHLPVLESFNSKKAHYFIEKPLAHNYNTISSYNISQQDIENTIVGYCMRYQPVFSQVKKILVKGSIGTVRSFNSKHFIASVTKKISGWRTDIEKSGGGALITNGSHLIDLLYWYFGLPNGAFGKSHFKFNKNIEDSFFGNLIYDNGLIGSLEIDWSRSIYRIPYTSIEINGDYGSIIVDDDGAELIIDSDNSPMKEGRYYYSSTDLYEGNYFDIAGGYYSKQTEAFINFAKTNEKGDLSDYRQSLGVQLIIDSLYRSNKAECKIISISNLK